MFQICIHAFCCGTINFSCTNIATKHTIFWIILKISSTKCWTVCVHSRSIPAVVINICIFLSHCFTKFLSNFFTPGLCKHYLHTIWGSIMLCHKVVNTCWSVTFCSRNFIDRFDCRCMPATKFDHIFHFIISQLIKQIIPLWIFIIQTSQVC